MVVLGVGGILFMNQLVAAPKVLFGRSLTAIPPSLFPMLTLGAMAILACLLAFSLRKSLFSEVSVVFEEGALGRVVALFGVMFFYAFAMEPLGFFISTVISLIAVSWIAGNRSIPQILIVSVVSPIALYLISTRALAVSLPELSAIEFFYAGFFN